MACFRLPDCEPEQVEHRLRAEFRIEVPVRSRNGHQLIRLSVAPYTTFEDLERLEEALRTIFPAAEPGGMTGS
jgi:selenocysteine lyase/cysteine desulfurase